MKVIKPNLSKLDYFAYTYCLFAFVYFLFFIRFGVQHIDEATYWFSAQFFSTVNRPFVDEWAAAQMSFYFLIPIYKLYKFFIGNTDCIILFMRHLFLIINTIFFLAFYHYLRKFGIWGLLSVITICGYVPGAIFALNYYTLPPRILLLICCILFYNKKEPSFFILLIIGFLLSFNVILLPPLAFLYIIYSSIVLYNFLRKKFLSKPQLFHPFFSVKYWLPITLAVICSICLLIVFLQLKSGFKNIFQSLPFIFTDSIFDLSSAGIFKKIIFNKLLDYIQTFGLVNTILMLVLFLLFILDLIMFYKKPNLFNKHFSAILLASCLTTSLCYLNFILFAIKKGTLGFTVYFFAVAIPLPFVLLSLISYLSCRNKSKEMLITMIIGMLSSIIVDSFSNATFGIYSILCSVPGIICLGQVFTENSDSLKSIYAFRKHSILLKRNKTIIKKRVTLGSTNLTIAKGSTIMIFACIIFLILSQGIYGFYSELGVMDITTLEKIDSGPYKELYTSHEIVKIYNDVIDDLDMIKENSTGPVYFYNCFPYVFLYLDLQSSNCWNSYHSIERQLEYFALHQQKQPDIICFNPYYFFSNEKFEIDRINLLKKYASLLCDGTYIQGKRIFCIKVSNWKDPTRAEIMNWVHEHEMDI